MPPAAPGVKIVVPLTPNPVNASLSVISQNQVVTPSAIAQTVIVSGGVPLPPNVSVKRNTPPPISNRKTLGIPSQNNVDAVDIPPGMIPTPHGYIPAVAPSIPKNLISGHGLQTLASAKGPSYKFPQPCSFVSFGFGGKLILCTPPISYNSFPNPTSGVTKKLISATPIAPRPLKIFKLIDVVWAALSQSSFDNDFDPSSKYKREMKSLIEIIRYFPGYYCIFDH
jgi:hypothetical protein